MRSNKFFATGGFTLILTTILLVDIAFGDIPINPLSPLIVDRSKLIGGVQKVQFELATIDPVTRKMSKPIYLGAVEFTQDGKRKGFSSFCGYGREPEIKENGDITIESSSDGQTLSDETIHIFDADGNIIESTPLYNKNGDYRKTVYIHEFDSRGNWTKRTWVKKGVDSSNQYPITPLLVEIRTIIYY